MKVRLKKLHDQVVVITARVERNRSGRGSPGGTAGRPRARRPQ